MQRSSKLLIEHNATDEDTGFQLATDGDACKQLDIRDPDGRAVLSVRTRGRLRQLGLTEMFFETEEPENAEVPIADNLAIEGEAELTHAIPAGQIYAQLFPASESSHVLLPTVANGESRGSSRKSAHGLKPCGWNSS